MEFFGLGGRSNNMFNPHQLIPQGDQDNRNHQPPHPVNDAGGMINRDNFVGAAGNEAQVEAAAAGEQPANAPKRKRYRRHTAYQIQRLEETFNEFPHPDDKQRRDLGRELGLTPVQIKFWFQNKRTQIKNQSEREENQRLKDENDRLSAENLRFKDALSSSCCPTCGGATTHVNEMTVEEQRVRMENVRLRDEIERITAMAAKHMGKPSPAAPRALVSAAGPSRLPAPEFVGLEGLSFPSGFPGTALGAEALLKALNCQVEVDKPFAVALAQVAMMELVEMARIGEPLWHIGAGGSPQTLNEEEYARMFPGGLGVKMAGLTTEVSRESATIRMTARRLTDFFVDSNKWALLFSSIVSRGTTVQVYEDGSDQKDYHDGVLQLMTAEMQVPSPLVPLREGLFLRYCKKQGEGLWAVVDVTLEVRHNPMIRYRRRPSGCLIRDLPNGLTKVIWVEHVETDRSGVHDLYKPVLDSGAAFGAQRWVSTLARQCQRLASLIDIKSPDPKFHATPSAMRNTLKLAEMMTASFCSGISGSSAHHWTDVSGTGVEGDVKVRSRKNNGMPGRPPGTVLSACASFWLPGEAKKLFNFLRSDSSRTEWDLLLQGSVFAEVVRIENSEQPGNCVSVLCDTKKANKVMVLQETCCDDSCFYVIFAPVDSDAMNSVFNGGEPNCVSLMPSGFTILPGGSLPADANSGRGSLVTVSFQILMDSGGDSTKISTASVATVDSLVTDTCTRIKHVVVGLDADEIK